MTSTQALRMAQANILRKRVDWDLSCRISPEGHAGAFRKATPQERKWSTALVRKEMAK